MEQKKAIGIDVSAKKLNIHITGSSQDFEIENSEKALEEFISLHSLSPEEYVVGAESTGRLYLVCQKIFLEKGFEFRLLNAILTNKKISLTVRKKKTDISDARIIANLLLQGEGGIVTKESLDTTKRDILRTRKNIVEYKSAIKRMKGDLEKAYQNESIKKVIADLEKLVEDMESCVKKLEENAFQKENITEEEKLIQSIPGFAVQLSAVVMSEVRDFKRFPSARQFKAYVGIDPKVMQSGNSLVFGGITKRGNPCLRSAFYLAAQVARQHDPELKAFFQKKIDEGKQFRVAIVAVARKLCERVFSVIASKTPYEIRPLPSA